MKSRQEQKLIKKQLFFLRQRTKETYKAAEAVLKEGIADLILVGSKEQIEEKQRII